ncbi:hypothetical protein BDF14DRAFT_1748214 [Spinellus fusiger]|nr:hypothetical protein BDF14DRAFT_1748214 [Spinellus fusiger]
MTYQEASPKMMEKNEQYGSLETPSDSSLLYTYDPYPKKTNSHAIQWIKKSSAVIGIALLAGFCIGTWYSSSFQSTTPNYQNSVETCHPEYQDLPELNLSIDPVESDSSASSMGDIKASYESAPPYFCEYTELFSRTERFFFSPEDFQNTSLFVNGSYSRGSTATISHATQGNKTTVDGEEDKVQVIVTLYAGIDKNLDELFSFETSDSNGQYAVKVQGPPHRNTDRNREPPNLEDCLLYHLHIIFPASVKTFEQLHFSLSQVSLLTGDHLQALSFGLLNAKVASGLIRFDELHADHIQLKVASGVIAGTYQPNTNFKAKTVSGTNNITVASESKSLSIHASCVSCRNTLTIPSENFMGRFVARVIAGVVRVNAVNSKDIHLKTHSIRYQEGYFKEPSESSITMHTTSGGAILNFV